jgi:hypothetical protein
MKGKKVLLVALISGLLLALTPLAATAAPANEDDGPECNPRAAVLATWMGVECPELMALQEQGVGFGVIMKAYFLSQALDLDGWDAVKGLMDLHRADVGWGQIVKAHTLAKLLGRSADVLLDEAQATGWGPIIQEYRVDNGPGKPPWAGKGKPPWAGKGKPPWAQGRGMPPWAGPHLLGE